MTQILPAMYMAFSHWHLYNILKEQLKEVRIYTRRVIIGFGGFTTGNIYWIISISLQVTNSKSDVAEFVQASPTTLHGGGACVDDRQSRILNANQIM